MPFNIYSLIDYLRSLNRKDLINFSYCLSLALIFWLLNALSNHYNSTLNFEVKYIKAPSVIGVKVIVNENELPKQLQININALGRDIVWYSIASYLGHIEIDLSKKMLESKNKTTGIINSNELFKSVTKKLTANVNILNVDPSIINLEFDRYYSKEIPVKVDLIKGELPIGIYDVRFRTIPDSVKVSGARKLLVLKKAWSTKPVDLIDIGKVQEIDIELSEANGVEVQPDVIKLIIEPDRFTEGELEVKIKKVNVPENLKITTYSKFAKVTFNAPMSLLSKLKQQDIVLAADFSDLDWSKEKTVHLDVTKNPKYVQVVSIEPSEMEFSIQKY